MKKYPIGFNTRINREPENETPVTTYQETVQPKKAVVQVYFPHRGMGWAYYNDSFDLKVGDFVYVEGKLGWKNNKIIDEDPGYGGAQIIEVLTGQADGYYLPYLQSMEISYIFAGETEIDVKIALEKLKAFMGINTLLLEGGSVVNGYFQRAGLIDELSFVVAPIVADAEDRLLFMNSTASDFELKEVKQYTCN